MKTDRVFLLMAFVLPLLFLDCYADAVAGVPNDFPPPVDKNNHVADLSGVEIVPPGFVKADGEKKAKDQGGESQEEPKKSSDKNDLKESPSEKKVKPVEVSKPEDNTGKGSSDERSDSQKLPLEDSRMQECDPSNRCIDDKNKFIACLRVPGNDSPALSLLIQNRGTASLTVNIVAPDFVKLEQTTVQLQAAEDKKVKVSVKDGANDTMILLKFGEGSCSLKLWDMISNSIEKSENSTLPAYTSLFTRASCIYMFLAAVVLIGVAWLYIKFRRMHHGEVGPGYQKVETVLPVSSGGKKETDRSDGWDNSWGDDWDDEEAPKTPSKPVLTLSSKGLASRRSNKDGWKD